MRVTMRSLFSLAAGAALAGCTLAPTYERPAAPVAVSYPDGPAYAQTKPAGGAMPVADIGWRDFFADPLLQRLIGLALANNRDLHVAALNVEAARAQYRIQRADLVPAIGATANGSAQRVPADLSPTGAARVSRSYQVGGVLPSWELDLFGRIRSLSEAALQMYFAQDETRVASQLSLMAEVASRYLAFRADQELLALTRETLNSQQNSYDLTRQSFEAGVASDLDLSQAEIALRTAERNLSQYTRQSAQDRNALVLLVGVSLPEDINAALDQSARLDDHALPPELPAGLPSELVARRPDIRSAEHQLRAANANIGAARAAFLPSIVLTGSAGTASASLGGLFDPGSGVWSFAPRISVPIFSGGALMAELDLSKVRKNIAIARYEKSIQAAFREVSDALAGQGTLDQQIRSQTQLVHASQRAYDAATQRFRQGVDNYLNVLDAQRSLYSARQTLVDTRLARLSNLVTLYMVLGGGWTEHSTGAPNAGDQTVGAADHVRSG